MTNNIIQHSKFTSQSLILSDPFDPSKMVVVGDSCLLFFNDISTQKAPSGNPKKLYLTLKENPNRKSRIAENLVFVNDLINSRDGLQARYKIPGSRGGGSGASPATLIRR